MTKNDFHDSTNNYLKSLDSFEAQRKFWLRMSGFVCVAVLGILYNWDKVMSHFLGWIFSSLGFIISVVWWYWTMRLIRINIQYRREEAKRVDEVMRDLNEIINDPVMRQKDTKPD